MLTASQEIDGFIERHRSKLNKQTNRQLPPPPPPPQPPMSQNQIQDRLDVRVARILDDPSSRLPVSQHPYYPPPPPSFPNNSFPEHQENFYAQPPPPPMPPQQQQQPISRRLSADNNDNTAAFFNKFGTYDDKRSQLKDDLKREYNEYLQSKRNIPESKSTSQLAPANQNTNKRVQFQQQNGKVVAPWEKGDSKTARNNQNTNDFPSTYVPNEPIPNRSRPPMSRDYDEQYIRDREEYVVELHAQIRELEARKRQLEIESSRLSAGPSSTVARAHYTEDLNALNSLLAERLDQRNAVDSELARILNRPPVSSSPTRVDTGGMPNLNIPMENIHQGNYQQPDRRAAPPNRRDNRPIPNNSNEFQIGHEVDKDSEQAAKKRYQQELQAQMREAQMRKAQQKREKDEYDRKLDEDIQRYNYFGRSGGGAPMRDKDGNVIANLGDLRNPQPPAQQQYQQQQQPNFPPDNKGYSLGNGFSSIPNAPFYNGEQPPPHQQQQPYYPPNSERPGSPNHARGAANNGIFGTAKTEAQLLKEEKYKQDLKNQIEEKRQREADEQAKRRAEEERELAKHLEWQQQVEKQMADEALRKQEKEDQERQQQLERQQQQQLQEEFERQKKQEEVAVKRKPKRPERSAPQKREETNYDDDQQKFNDEEQSKQPEAAYRSSSPPVPALKNKDKKTKTTGKNVRREPSSDDINQQQPAGRNAQREQSFDDTNQHQQPPVRNIRRQPSYDDANQLQSPPPLSPLNANDDYPPQTPHADDRNGHGRHTYRKPPTPRQPDVSNTHKKPPQTYRARPRADSNAGMPLRTNSVTSLRSDGSDSEVLNRLEHLKRQLKDKEARLQDHVNRHQKESNDQLLHKEQYSKFTYQPPTQPPFQRQPSPQFLLNAARVHHHRDSPTNSEKMRRLLPADDDVEFRPGYFRDDAILMGGNAGHNDNDYYSSSKRIDSGNRMFATNIEKEASRRKYGPDPTGLYDNEDPTAIANIELNRIAEQNEQRLKKLRDLENDDASLLDSNEVLERFQQRQRMQRGGSQTTLQDDAWLK